MANALSEQLAVPESQALSFAARLGLLVAREMTVRRDRRLTTRLRQAKWRRRASVEEIDYRHPRGRDTSLILRLVSCPGVHERSNVLITGPTGIGTTWLACALGHQACRAGSPVLALRWPRLLQELPIATGDARTPKLMASLAQTALLILDDGGLAPLSAESRRDILELLEDRHGRSAPLVTRQFPVDHWHQALGDPTLADAMLDRLLHNAYKMTLRGDAMRKRHAVVHHDVLTTSPDHPRRRGAPMGDRWGAAFVQIGWQESPEYATGRSFGGRRECG
jgi:DNA replication protein DnaC